MWAGVARDESAPCSTHGRGARSPLAALLAQVARCGYLLDVQGKGYSSRLKLLLHTGRLVFIARRPWQVRAAPAAAAASRRGLEWLGVARRGSSARLGVARLSMYTHPAPRCH